MRVLSAGLISAVILLTSVTSVATEGCFSFSGRYVAAEQSDVRWGAAVISIEQQGCEKVQVQSLFQTPDRATVLASGEYSLSAKSLYFLSARVFKTIASVDNSFWQQRDSSPSGVLCFLSRETYYDLAEGGALNVSQAYRCTDGASGEVRHTDFLRMIP